MQLEGKLCRIAYIVGRNALHLRLFWTSQQVDTRSNYNNDQAADASDTDERNVRNNLATETYVATRLRL